MGFVSNDGGAQQLFYTRVMSPSACSESSSASPPQAAYFIVLAGVCAALHVWKLPPALPELQQELGLNLVRSGFMLSLVQLFGMVAGMAVGLFAVRIGLRRSVLWGLTLLALCSALGTFARSEGVMLVFRAIEGCAFLMVAMPAPGLIRQTVHPAYLNRVLSVWGAYLPTGTALILLFGSWILVFTSWRVLWWGLSALTVFIWWLAWTYIPADTVMITSSRRQDAADRFRWWDLIKVTLTSQNVWLMALCFAAYTFQWATVIGFLPTIYNENGISGLLSGVLTGIAAAANIVGNVLAGYFLHRGVRAAMLLITGFLVMEACVLITFSPDVSPVFQYGAVLLFSGVGGLIPGTLFTLAVSCAPSTQTIPSTVGWMQQCNAFGQFVGPPLVAGVVMWAGNWQWTGLVTGVCMVLGVWFSWRLGARIPG